MRRQPSTKEWNLSDHGAGINPLESPLCREFPFESMVVSIVGDRVGGSFWAMW